MLPKGWVEASLGEIADTKLGKMLDQAKNNGELTPYLRNINVRWGSFDLSDLGEMRVNEDELEQLVVRDGDIFVCEGGEPGRAAVWRHGEGKIVFQKALHRLRPLAGINEDLVSTYLAFAGRNNLFDGLLTGTTIKHLPQDALIRLRLPLPPLAEQRRIVCKLDALTARLTRARAELARVLTLATRLRNAAINTAFYKIDSKGLFNSDQARWTLHQLGDLIIDGPSNGWSPKSGEDATGALTLKLTATTSGRLRLDDAATKRIYEIPPSNSKYWLRPGDILIQRANSLDYVGATAIFDGPPNTFIYPDLMMRVRIKNVTLRRLIWYFINSKNTRQYFQGRATGTAGNMPKISGSTVRELLVPVPPDNEQAAVLAGIDNAFVRADRLEAEAAKAAKLLDRLEAAILAKAFRGELVPQNPDDEPASVLLDRIRAERAAAPKAERGRRPSQSKV